MSASTTGSKPAKRTGRRIFAALIALVFLFVGVSLLYYSFVLREDGEHGDASPVVSRSPVVMTTTLPGVFPTPSPGATVTEPEPSVVVTTSYVTVTVAAAPGSSESGLLPLMTTISGLLASVAGIVSAIVSMRAPRARS